MDHAQPLPTRLPAPSSCSWSLRPDAQANLRRAYAGPIVAPSPCGSIPCQRDSPPLPTTWQGAESRQEQGLRGARRHDDRTPLRQNGSSTGILTTPRRRKMGTRGRGTGRSLASAYLC